MKPREPPYAGSQAGIWRLTARHMPARERTYGRSTPSAIKRESMNGPGLRKWNIHLKELPDIEFRME